MASFVMRITDSPPFRGRSPQAIFSDPASTGTVKFLTRQPEGVIRGQAPRMG
jgi:hypothetical protein